MAAEKGACRKRKWSKTGSLSLLSCFICLSTLFATSATVTAPALFVIVVRQPWSFVAKTTIPDLQKISRNWISRIGGAHYRHQHLPPCVQCATTLSGFRWEQDICVPVEFRLTLPPALNHWHIGLSTSAGTFSLSMYSAPATSWNVTIIVTYFWLAVFLWLLVAPRSMTQPVRMPYVCVC